MVVDPGGTLAAQEVVPLVVILPYALEVRPEHDTPFARETPAGFPPSPFMYKVGGGDLVHEFVVDCRLGLLHEHDLFDRFVECWVFFTYGIVLCVSVQSLQRHDADQHDRSAHMALLAGVLEVVLQPRR